MECPTGCICDWSVPKDNERLSSMLKLLTHSKNYIDQVEGRSGITGQEHALRCAALGMTSDFYDMAFLGLVHDLGRPLNDVHHGELMAEMVRDRVSEDAYHILRTHGAYQSAIVHKTDFPVEPWSKHAKQLAAFELRSFSPEYTGPAMTLHQGQQLLRAYLS